MRTLPLHDLHASSGARLGERAGAELVLDHGSPVAELQALESAAVLVDRSYRAILSVAGPEARLFLHGMVTNDVKGLAPGQGNHAAVINARGKMLGDGRVLGLEGEELLFDMEPDAREGVAAHLALNLVSEECELKDLTGGIGILGVYGPRATEVVSHFLGAELPALPQHHHVSCFVGGQPGLLVAAAPAGVPGWELWLPVAALSFAWPELLARVQAVGGLPAGDVAMEAARIAHAIPRYGQDLDESTIPLEANMDDAISYTKGCYVGQEVIAKATYRGQVRRKLGRLLVPAGTTPGSALVEGDKTVGTVTSVSELSESEALAYVRRDRLAVGNRLALEGGGEVEIRWAPPVKEG